MDGVIYLISDSEIFKKISVFKNQCAAEIDILPSKYILNMFSNKLYSIGR